MRVLIVGLNYLPESTSIGPYTADLAEYLAGEGHHVQAITGFPQAPQWKIWDNYQGKWFMREVINGVPVLRTWLYLRPNPDTAFNRILFDLSFSLSAFLGGLLTGPCDLLVIISPPLQLGLTGWLLSLFKRAPFFFHIQDLVPDAAVATGMLHERSWTIRLGRILEGFIYRRAHGVGVICEGFARNLLAKRVPPDKLRVLPNYIDLDFIHPLERNNTFRAEHGIGRDDFVVMYSGSVALKQGLHTLVEAAAQLQDYRGIIVYLIGEGPSLAELKARASGLGLRNIHFLPLQPRERLAVQLSAADVLVITQKQAVTDIVFPGKLLYYMAAGRPILAAVSPDSETGRFINARQVGMVVPPEDPEALRRAILSLCQNGAAELGENARRVASEKFDRKKVLKQFAQHLQELERISS
jgi:putative colanic acid biosynthesis glycosyltransferase WcaI